MNFRAFGLAIAAGGLFSLTASAAPQLDTEAGRFIIEVKRGASARNLVGNAGGRIAVCTARTHDPDGVRISFQDSGVGISSSALLNIFDPFYSTKPEGLGLGLSISQEIVQQHGGRIEAKSQLGRGAAFTVWFPFAAT